MRNTPLFDAARTNLRRDAVERAWAYYCETFRRGPSYILSSTRLKHGERGYDALKKHCSKGLELPEEKHEASIAASFEIAIDRMKDSPFHNGQNDRHKKYNDWENLFRSPNNPSPDHLLNYWLDDDRWEGGR